MDSATFFQILSSCPSSRRRYVCITARLLWLRKLDASSTVSPSSHRGVVEGHACLLPPLLVVMVAVFDHGVLARRLITSVRRSPVNQREDDRPVTEANWRCRRHVKEALDLFGRKPSWRARQSFGALQRVARIAALQSRIPREGITSPR